MNQVNLSLWGLTDRIAQAASEFPAWIPGRILSQEKGLYRVITQNGEQNATLAGKFRYQAQTASELPAVGDFVLLESAGADLGAVIHRLLPRKSVFIRKAAGTGNAEQVIAANVDTVLICMSLNNDFNLRRLERYLAVAWESGAAPVVVLTKTDLCGDAEEKKSAVSAVASGAEVLTVSALEKDGCASILPYLGEGRTVALIGSSGVGKSTLINRLLGENRQDINGLRNDDKGRHTTTRRQLFLLPQGGTVIDTPGMRELGMWDASEGLEKTFSDLEELARTCRFRNCSHTNEPGCAVRKAVESGLLPEERLRSYRKLNAEIAYSEDSQSYLALKNKKFQEISKINKSNRKRS